MISAERRAYERQEILSGENWPHFPLLPVKNDNTGDLGVIAYVEPTGGDRSVRVYQANLHAISTGKLAEVLTPFPYTEYDSLDEFFDAGWRGD